MTTGTEPSGPRLLPVADGRRTRAVLGELLRPRRGTAVAALVALVAGSAVSLVAAPLLGRIVDLAARGAAPSALTAPVAASVPSTVKTTVYLYVPWATLPVSPIVCGVRGG